MHSCRDPSQSCPQSSRIRLCPNDAQHPANPADRTLRPSRRHRFRRRTESLRHRRRPRPAGALRPSSAPSGTAHRSQAGPSSSPASALFVIEFFADKIPAFDLLWNALHTFIRVPVAGLLAYQATSQLSPEHQLLATLLGAAVALAAHGGKTAARAAVTPSPEPFSNITLSLGEDALAIALTWLATRHPYAAGTLAAIFVVIIVLLIRWVIRAMQALFRGAEHELAS